MSAREPGFAEGQLLGELYSNAYLYVLPSDLDAMSYGNCCVVSDIPECAEVAEDRAVLFVSKRPDNGGPKVQ